MFNLNILLVMFAIIVHGQEIEQLISNDFNLVDFFGLEKDYYSRIKRQLPLNSSASKFLLEVYSDITENGKDLDHLRQHLHHGNRQKRALIEENFITELDRMEIKNCNNIITFSSTKPTNFKTQLIPNIPIASDMQISFNMNNVPSDFHLVQSALRIYQEPSFGKYANKTVAHMATIAIYINKPSHKEYIRDLNILTSINTTINYKGWLEFNMTHTLQQWLQPHQTNRVNKLIVGVTLNVNSNTNETRSVEVLSSDLGLVKPDLYEEMIDLQPFIIGYFNGPERITKTQINRFKRDVVTYRTDFYKLPSPSMQQIYKLSKTCERLNFTLDFKDLHMHNWIIAPEKFEAYFCGGECNFPLASRMNATNHAIVQTLMHLKDSSVPKPSCTPTVLNSISILHYLSEESVNLSKYPQSVVKECGCH